MGKQTTTPLIRSRYFNLSEFIRSATALRLGISNIPSDRVIANIQYGCDKILDPFRDKLGKPILITSGYRCPQLNKIVGGVANSWHTIGNAADIRIESEEDAKRKFDILKSIPEVDTCLFEHSSIASWLHVQWDSTKTPRQHFNFNFRVL